MKILNIVFVVLISFFIAGCNEEIKPSNTNFKSIKGFDEISQDKMTFLFLSKPGCKWCAKQKEDFKNLEYIKKYPEYDFIKIESDEPLFKQFYTSAFPISSFPTLVIMQRNESQFIVVEKIEGYSKPEVLESILEFNKDLVKK